MKMMIKTSRISINGTIFGVAMAPLFSPTSIAIASSPVDPLRHVAGELLAPGGSRRDFINPANE
jgi:hypothetical protein